MFVRTKRFKNKDGSVREYLFIVKNVWREGKVRQLTLGNLGRLDVLRKGGEIDSLVKKLAPYCQRAKVLELGEENLGAEWSKEYGPVLIFRRLWRELGFDEILTRYLKERKFEADVAEAVLAMVVNRIVEPRSKRGVDKWIRGVYEERWEKLSLQHFYRAMDFLGEKKEKMEEEIFFQVTDLFNQKLDLVLFDTTSIVYRGEGKFAEGLLEYGFSKERRSDLKQIIVGILMTKEGLPVGHEIYPGSTNDLVAFEKIIEKVKARFNLRRIIFVCDRGMVSEKNLKLLEESRYEYIVGVRMRKLEPAKRKEFLKASGMRWIKKDLRMKEMVRAGRRYVICLNPEEAEKDKAKREEIIARLKEKLKSQGIKSLLINREYAKYLRIVAEKPAIDDKKVKQEEIYDGKYILATNTAQSAKEVVLAYKGLWQVEAAFRELKDELELGPIYHWTEPRIRSHVFICFLALILKLSFKKKLRAVSEEASCAEALEGLKQVKAVKIKIERRRIILRTDLPREALLGFKALGLKVPAKILECNSS